jgi:deoxycytidylate deaminase
MGALVNAAKSGVAAKGSTMYVTTFPCHLCIKHIIASGISRVVYLEPYEKSQTEEYYKKSIVLNPDSQCPSGECA